LESGKRNPTLAMIEKIAGALGVRFLPFGYPYKEVIYYRESSVYHEGSDPVDMKYSFINEPISAK
jgi:transcriptional regulator with XRE-family HTH domain